MKKNCVLNLNKICDNCGECDICDLDPNKTCNNCGKCLNINGFDTRSIKIDDVIDDEAEAKKFEEEAKKDENVDEVYSANEVELLNDYNDDYVDTDKKEEIDFELIDDIDGLNEILEDEEKRKKYIDETYPGMFVIKKSK
ncbi:MULTISPECIES: hypothetical protein [Clostridium]|uniref:hypothetical protein n=1 Tax=Clostridium TaxID=1485 RepID=UPI00069D0B42|nr:MULTISPECIES: hypothetical protein [Clostridium]KOF56874.1 hypothetical protein AGR56_09575 [Clostridium sp. DMHC 10]MCD2345931.1 hypothetical protein [Clostridium guangxiense]